MTPSSPAFPAVRRHDLLSVRVKRAAVAAQPDAAVAVTREEPGEALAPARRAVADALFRALTVFLLPRLGFTDRNRRARERRRCDGHRR